MADSLLTAARSGDAHQSDECADGRSIARDRLTPAALVFRTIHLVVEGSVASWTCELTATDANGPETIMSSIETFKVADGRITDVWNAEHTPGPWL